MGCATLIGSEHAFGPGRGQSWKRVVAANETRHGDDEQDKERG